MTTEKNKTTPSTPGTPAIVEKTMADNVLTKIKMYEEAGMIHLPKDYSAPNALKVAWLIILEVQSMDKKPALEVCTPESVANALLKMVVQGLNPVKRQCSFIVYGNKLTCQREYQGTIAIAKRDCGVKHVTSSAVFNGDEFEFEINVETGVKRVIKHTSKLENLGGEVIGAYATKEYDDGRKETEIMNINEIRMAWSMNKMKEDSPAHKKFPGEMARKTVIGRLLKPDVNSSTDAVLMEDQDDEFIRDPQLANVTHQITDKSNNGQMITIHPTPEKKTEKVEPKVPEPAGEQKVEETTTGDEKDGPGF